MCLKHSMHTVGDDMRRNFLGEEVILIVGLIVMSVVLLHRAFHVSMLVTVQIVLSAIRLWGCRYLVGSL